MSKDIVPKESALPSVYDPSDYGNLEFSSGLLECRIGHSTSTDINFKPGQFNFVKSDWPAQEKLVGLSMISVNKGQVLFGPTLTSPSQCGSDDGLRPAQRYREPVSDSCVGCYARAWRKDMADANDIESRAKLAVELQTKRPDHPLCLEKIDVAFVDERMIPFYMSFTKTGIKVVMDQLINKLRFSGKRPFQVQFDVSLERRQNEAKNTWSVCKFENFRPVEGREEIHNQYKPLIAAYLSKHYAQLDAEKTVVGIDEGEEIPF